MILSKIIEKPALIAHDNCLLNQHPSAHLLYSHSKQFSRLQFRIK